MINYLATQKNWKNAFSDTITSFQDLAQLLNLPLQVFDEQVGDFPLKVPRRFVDKMQKGNINDPLLLQILPTFQETLTITGFITDPLDEQNANPIKGLIHKYRSRVLIPVTGACMVHCRYCFRQHFDYQDNMPNQQDWQTIQQYIQSHVEVNEVILSGGDPLSLSDRRLFAILSQIEALPQIHTIRLHTRVPVVIPERLDNVLLERLSASRCHIVMVIHSNHPQELDEETIFYLKRLKQAGITLLNQTVLLKNINDDVEILAKLSEKLWSAEVLPYYLHVLDKVAGAAHFWISDEMAVNLYWQLLERCSGYLVPKLVREIPNQPYKTPINIYQNLNKIKQNLNKIG